ncbi:heme ABC exporter ATP-binding protein CcmA [Siccirubricoccus sp. KC 17139]|uniref:Heme ABC exporter ATP-binding protein CcmA n=1 Tax=Siccirubricoccus soli TaxID=2899147 RepID=A0ABT1DBZ0_9PROT|nr:heme ABC exporter ATP-binding protein CcmA [Siccirubricoccus soli]MCO6419419.1 heme ABC exporter ATP-binding protein CcmA [Siccirubricoccus soli]MCP2685554.1 heme ABC exporter ATP-binding protein CcmA [Siccirubricoccus soli]
MLQAENLACLRGERVVFAGLSFALNAGEAVQLLGPNGAGKSSLLRLLAGLLTPAEGRLLWQGQDALADRAAHAARLRYLSHQDALKPALTAAENLGFYARLWGGEVAPALAAMGLAPLAELPARVLSAGQKRRLALARLALAPVPLWLLDEPTVGLDAASVARLGTLLAAHRAAGGMVLAATHLPLPLPGARELRL